jgi:formylglycine-generating enzyme required for sulfatase activity
MVKKIIGIAVTGIFLLTACNKAEVISMDHISGRGAWFEPTPFGMVFVDRGSFHLGPSDDEITEDTKMRSVSVEAFWMDDTEITNNEYRQFVFWVRDSIARKMLGASEPEFLITEDNRGVPLTEPVINWKARLNWNDPDVRTTLSDMYIPDNERFKNRLEIDSRKLVYDYYWIDFQQAARRANSFDFKLQKPAYHGVATDMKGKTDSIRNRSSFIMHESVAVYPDTLSWIRDFSYSYNEPMTYKYFNHPAFEDYPVVGVNWNQARAFCNWRTRLNENYRSRMNDVPAHDFRLPTESEWELASRGGHMDTKYPWGSYYTRNSRGCFMANFKPLRGNYVADSRTSATSMKVGSFDPNDYGLYDMAGNVAEWTSTAFFESGYDLANDLNPEVDYKAHPDDPPVMRRKVVRGGSWKDAELFIRNSTRSYEYLDTAKSYIGFRCVRSSFKKELQNK